MLSSPLRTKLSWFYLSSFGHTNQMGLQPPAKPHAFCLHWPKPTNDGVGVLSSWWFISSRWIPFTPPPLDGRLFIIVTRFGYFNAIRDPLWTLFSLINYRFRPFCVALRDWTLLYWVEERESGNLPSQFNRTSCNPTSLLASTMRFSMIQSTLEL